MRAARLILLLSIAFLAAAQAHSEDKMPYTSFQTPTAYRADNDIRTDAVIAYTDSADVIRSWQQKGYIVQTMFGFRADESYVKDHKDEVQTASDGTFLTCGNYYMVPTPNRVKIMVDFFSRAIANGTSAVVPEEPEFFAAAGYSDSFKQAWQQRYGEPWQDPESSIEARYKASRLMADMEYDLVRSILDSAQKQKSEVRRMVACHSAPSYYSGNIIYPHYQCLNIPSLQEIIAQVWTGTARQACRYRGKAEERTFENAFLEYSSLYNLARGTGKRMWFLMDPLEDNPDRTMEDYHTNYEKTLVASLMFPEVDAYEVMPWPNRIYGRVPDEFATEIGSVINALQDMHNQSLPPSPPRGGVGGEVKLPSLARGGAGGEVHFDTGTRSIATFVADSMAWQRGMPNHSNFDSFYGLTLPLIYQGIPVQVAQLERVVEKGYLKPYKVILMSYDILKPMKPEYNQALADWVKQGGVLVFFGGTDAYNALPEWWSRTGFDSPQADLYSRLGVNTRLRSLQKDTSARFDELTRAGAKIRDISNRKTYTFDLTRYAVASDRVYIRFRDAFPGDGWGPAIFHMKLTVDKTAVADFVPGTDAERPFIWEDDATNTLSGFRFADAESSITYAFNVPRGSSPVLEVDMGNQFVIEASSQVAPAARKIVHRGRWNEFGAKSGSLSIPSHYPLTIADTVEGQTYSVQGAAGSVVFDRLVGKGVFIHVGIPPAFFASSSEAADLLLGIAGYACVNADFEMTRQGYMAIRRGKYVAVRTFDGQKKVMGSYVDILDPSLPVRRNPLVKPWQTALYAQVQASPKVPTIAFCSGKLESSDETPRKTTVSISGALKTKGAVRLLTAGRAVESVQPDSVKVKQEGETCLLTFDNNPDSVHIQVNWR